jgi:hypothetical protein
MNNITPEYVVDYFTKNDKNIEDLKSKVNTLENEKALVTERNANLLFRVSTLEQQVRDLNNTLMNHFAYGAQEFKRKNPVDTGVFGNTLNTLPTPVSPPPGFGQTQSPFSFPVSNPFGKN